MMVVASDRKVPPGNRGRQRRSNSSRMARCAIVCVNATYYNVCACFARMQRVAYADSHHVCECTLAEALGKIGASRRRKSAQTEHTRSFLCMHAHGLSVYNFKATCQVIKVAGLKEKQGRQPCRLTKHLLQGKASIQASCEHESEKKQIHAKARRGEKERH
jgi:hypothetical protein